MKLDEKWIRAHLPEDCRDEPINWFSGLYLDGLTMNRWFKIPHWGYDYEDLCFIEVSDSREYSSDSDNSEEIKPDCIIRVED